jgi:MOSC domain-containing protein YiiM
MTPDIISLADARGRPVRSGAIVSVQVGQVAPLGPDGVASGFVKSPVTGPVAVGPLSLAGDTQADLRVHGGPDKAVCIYPAEHYASWRRDQPEHVAMLVPGGFGENLTTVGLDENTICIGDVLRVGSALLQVTQPRQPCFKLALRFADPHLPRAMQRTGRSGWYARVLEDGLVENSSPIIVAKRLNPTWPVSRLVRVIAHRSVTLEEMAELSDLPGLAAQWRRIAAVSVKQSARQLLRLATAARSVSNPSSV